MSTNDDREGSKARELGRPDAEYWVEARGVAMPIAVAAVAGTLCTGPIAIFGGAHQNLLVVGSIACWIWTLFALSRCLNRRDGFAAVWSAIILWVLFSTLVAIDVHPGELGALLTGQPLDARPLARP